MAKKAQLDEKELQQKYVEFQVVTAQIKQLQKAVQLLEEQSFEISSVSEGLEDIKKMRKGAEMLVPIAGGIFIKGELKENSELIVNVGSNVAVAKTAEDTKKLLEERTKEISSEKEELVLQLQGLIQMAQNYQDEIEKLVADQEQNVRNDGSIPDNARSHER